MKKYQLTVMALGFCLLLLSVPQAVWATDGQIKIGPPAEGASFPIVINQAGSYVLTDNLEVSDSDVDAIRIVVNNVTLDLNGHTIKGTSGGNGSGIWAENRYSITILNGRVWGFGSNGISLSSTEEDPSQKNAGHILKGVQSLNNIGTGITIYGSAVSNCIANGNGGDGIHAFYSSLNHCTTNKNASVGLDLWNSTAFNCTADWNSGVGVLATGSTIDNMTSQGNTGGGININSSSLTNCTVSVNYSVGITASYSTIDNMTSQGNIGDGISVSSSFLSNCTAMANTGNGISAYYSRVENNLVSSNQGYGIQIGSNHNFVIKNMGNTNTGGNISSFPSENYVPLTGDNANLFF